MASFLAALGRSQALTQTTRAIEDIQKTKREERVFEFEERQRQRQEETYNRTIDISVHPSFLRLPQETQKQTLNFFAEQGLTDEAGKGKVGDVLQGIQMVETSSKLFKQFMSPVVENMKQTSLALLEEIDEETSKDKPNPQKIEALQQKYNNSLRAYNMSLDNYDKSMMFIKDKEKKGKGKLTEDKARDKLIDLENLKVKLRSGKGLNELEKIRAVAGGIDISKIETDLDSVMKQIDSNIAYYQKFVRTEKVDKIKDPLNMGF